MIEGMTMLFHKILGQIFWTSSLFAFVGHDLSHSVKGQWDVRVRRMHTKWRACARGLINRVSEVQDQLRCAKKRPAQDVPLVAAACSLTAARSRLKALSAAPWKPDWPAPWSWRRPNWRRMGERNCLAARVVNMVAVYDGEWRVVQLLWLLLNT